MVLSISTPKLFSKSTSLYEGNFSIGSLILFRIIVASDCAMLLMSENMNSDSR